MLTSFQTYLVLIVLTVMVFLGDEKQSIVLFISTLGILYLFFRDWRFGPKKLYIEKRLLPCWLLLFVSLFFSSLHPLSLGYAVTNIVRYVDAFLLFVYVSNKGEKLSVSTFSHPLFYWVGTMVGASYLFMLFPSLQSLVPKMNVLYTSYGHNHIVDIIFFVIPYGFLLAWRKPSPLPILLVAVLVVGVLTASSRGAVMVLLLACLFPVVLCVGKFKQFHQRALGIVGVLVCVFTLALLSLRLPAENTTLLSLGRISKKTSLAESRVKYWIQASDAIVQKPLLGWGPGSFALVSKRFQRAPDSYSWFAHSFPIQILSELGILGFLAMSLIIIKILLRPLIGLWRTRDFNDHRLSLSLGLLLVFLYSCVEINLDFTVVWVLFWILLGVVNQKTLSTENKQSYVSVSLFSPMFFIGLFCLSSVLGTAFQFKQKGSVWSALSMPYDEKTVGKYLDTLGEKQPYKKNVNTYLQAFHLYNPDILSKLAVSEKSPAEYNRHMRKAIEADPQNRLLLERYITTTLNSKRSEDLLYVITVMIETISIHKKEDRIFIENHWKDISSCFNEDALIWDDSPNMDTYQAKSIYYASLCLVKNSNKKDAKKLMQIAVDSLPSWSTIYIDYASLLLWSENNQNTAKQVIQLCKENPNARGHCSQFDKGILPQKSVFDPSVKFIQ